MSKLAAAVKAKLEADKVSPTAAAKAVGLSLPSFRGMLKGKSSPNARSLKKYAKLLGVSEDDVKGMVGATAAKPAKGKPGRKPGRKAKGKPGRKPGRKAKGKPGRKPGRKAGRPAGRKAGIAPVVALLQQAESIMSDDLAVAVHGMGKAQRATLSAIIASLA